MSDTERQGFEGWAILELMGHRRLAGLLSEATIGGASMIRIDIPKGETAVTQFYSGGAVYCITPCTEDAARRVAEATSFRGPVSEYELPRLTAGDAADEDDDEDRGEPW